MRRVTILGLIAASAIGTVVLVANAQQVGGRADFWPKIKGNPVVQEWYSDIPWHQKLGTQGGNEIDEALGSATGYCLSKTVGNRIAKVVGPGGTVTQNATAVCASSGG